MVLTLEYREWTVRTLLMAHLAANIEVTTDNMIDLCEEFIDGYVEDLESPSISRTEFGHLTQAVLAYCHRLSRGNFRLLPSLN